MSNGMTCDLRNWLGAVLILVMSAGTALAQQEAGNQAKPASPAKRTPIYDKTADANASVG